MIDCQTWENSFATSFYRQKTKEGDEKWTSKFIIQEKNIPSLLTKLREGHILCASKYGKSQTHREVGTESHGSYGEDRRVACMTPLSLPSLEFFPYY